MKLFAVRDKETGEFGDYLSDDYVGEWFLSQTHGVLWVNAPPSESTLARISSQFKNECLLEVITLRIEPTEPCVYCADLVPAKIQPYGHIEPMYCDMCGRRLADGQAICERKEID